MNRVIQLYDDIFIADAYPRMNYDIQLYYHELLSAQSHFTGTAVVAITMYLGLPIFADGLISTCISRTIIRN